ncbi:MAG: tetratricopeptide repeat protein [Clostridiales bacterium]|nr:tetratricopeptide repeat protein [Clostridiales bacterium]
MGKYYDDRVEFAVRYLWLEPHAGKAKEAVQKLEEAVKDGDGDACFFLGRCYCGPCFVMADCGVEEDEVKARGYFNMSLERGSAVGMFGTRRLGGFHPKDGTYIHEPFHSDAEIWDAVNQIAQQGEPFALYLIGNAYYYGDVVDFFGIDWDSMSDEQQYHSLHQWRLDAIPILERAVDSGMNFAVGNLIDIISSGDFGIPKDEKKEQQLIEKGAELGHAFYEYRLGKQYEEKKDFQNAELLYERSSRHGEESGSFALGRLYTFGGPMPQDLNKAKHYFELSLKQDPEMIGGHNRLGEIYFYGGDGINQDYDKAFMHFEKASELENDWASDMLGTCYLKGLGTSVDYAKALEKLQVYPDEKLSAIGLGEIYAYGLGVPVDIKKAMKYWDKYPNDERVLENKKNFRKTLFGWKRKE